MIKLKKFNSNLASPTDDHFPDMPYKGNGWQVTFGPNVQFVDGSITYYSSGSKPLTPKHILIQAVNETSAQNALNLILAACCLTSGSYSGDSYNINGEVSLWKKDLTYDVDSSISVDRYQYACLVASRASYRKYYQYALEKYKLSQQCFPTSIDALDPQKWRSQKKVYNSAQHHVRTAQAITLGYSVIEELGLEIRASQKIPSFISGKWNLPVKEDLEGRLIKSNIDLSEKIDWVLRDAPTKIEMERPVPRVKKSSWSYSRVRDSQIELVDAIALASWLRSKTSAHRLNKISASLSYYDVANIHFLSRRLILESLGLWRFKKYIDE